MFGSATTFIQPTPLSIPTTLADSNVKLSAPTTHALVPAVTAPLSLVMISSVQYLVNGARGVAVVLLAAVEITLKHEIV